MSTSGRSNLAESAAQAALGPAMVARFGERIAHLGFKPINHVLSQHQWARDKLAMHTSKTVRLGLAGNAADIINSLPLPSFVLKQLQVYLEQAPSSVDCQIAADGTLIPLPLLSPSEQAEIAAPSVTMLVKPTAESIKAAVNQGPSGLQSHLVIEGDVMLAATLGEIAQHARWDFEDDLSFITGDKIARRVGSLADKADARMQEVLPKLTPHINTALDKLSGLLSKPR